MKSDTYPYDQKQASRYTFTSIGKKVILKEVVFTHTGVRNIVNMGFGDVLPDGSIDDKANSNNKDFIINGIIKEGQRLSELPFEPKVDVKYVGFLIRKKL